MSSNKQTGSPILVTGAHRTGTTWVGKTLAKAPTLAYIHEPFNLRRRPGICNAPIDKWYTYVHEENGRWFYEPVKATFGFRYAVAAELSFLETPHDVGRMVRDVARLAYLRHWLRPRPLVKDPFALFSARWFFRRFDARILILIRHPAAYVSSILKKGWSFPFDHWLSQEALLRDHLSQFASEIQEYAHTSQPLLDQAILLWKAAHHVVDRYRVEHPSWLVVRHEDLARDPTNEFAKLIRALELKWSSELARFIHQSTSSRNPVEPSGASVFDVDRDSKATVKAWQTRLSRGQIHYIRQATESISQKFYTADDWC